MNKNNKNNEPNMADLRFHSQKMILPLFAEVISFDDEWEKAEFFYSHIVGFNIIVTFAVRGLIYERTDWFKYA